MVEKRITFRCQTFYLAPYQTESDSRIQHGEGLVATQPEYSHILLARANSELGYGVSVVQDIPLSVEVFTPELTAHLN